MRSSGLGFPCFLLLLGLAACAARQAPVPTDSLQLVEGGIEFDGPAGEELLQLDARRDEIVLSNARGATLARYRLEAGRIRIKSRGSHPFVFVVREGGDAHGLRITDERGRTLYSLRSEPDGDLRLEDASGAPLYKIKRRDYGFKIATAGGQLEGKVRSKEHKISLRGAAGQSILSTRDPMPPIAVAVLALRSLRPSERVGLTLAILHWGTAGL